MAESKNDIASTLLAGNFDRHTPSVQALSDPIADTPMVLTLDELRAYEHNPRITRNPLYDEIKASILQRGLDAPPAVTRRPGESHYIIRNGGNTRLSILRELWSQTKDERFYRICCLYRPWQSEIVALTGHLTENELHGKLTFIEKALGVDKAREFYEQELQKTLSQADLAKRLTADGFPCDQSQISRMQDAINFLLPAIPTSLYGGLHYKLARKILTLRQTALHFYSQHLSSHVAINDFDILFEELLSQLDTDPSEFDMEHLQDELVGEIAKVTGCHYDVVALEILHKNSKRFKSQAQLPVSPAPATETLKTTQQIPAEFVKPDLTQVLAQAQDHSSKFVVRPHKTAQSPPSPSAAQKNTVSLTEQSQENKQQDDFIAAHIVSPIDTSSRVESIQQMVANHTGEEINDFKDNVIKAIPVQAGGLNPISDVWFIESSIDTPQFLRMHIEQLAIEIADEFDCAQHITADDQGIGFICSIQEQSPVLTLLGALSQTPANHSIESPFLYEQLASLLLSHKNDEEEAHCLSDQAIVKLFRLIRLSRRLIELTLDHPCIQEQTDL